MADVLNEILRWSSGRPNWQRDALRRLVTTGELNETNVTELANLCKSQHGLSEKAKGVPLSAEHLPQPGVGSKSVFLKSLTHHSGVNALAQDQTIEFGRSLTVVFGENAAGKSGYTRILKRACRARGAEEILGNVASTTIPGRPSATIKFTADEESYDQLWDDDQSPNQFLSRVSVFDRYCASVYVAQRTDVAFRPLGLDLFDKLSDVCEAVKKILDKEQSALESQRLQNLDVAEGTAVHELIANLTSLTNPDSVKELGALTEDDKIRTEEVRRRLRELQSDDPERVAGAIDLRVRRAGGLAGKIKTTDAGLSDISVKELFEARDRQEQTRRVLEEFRKETLQTQPLSNTGSDAWRTLWNAARQFSTADAYPDHAFPFTEEGSRCVLCQQGLADDGVRRLRQFKEFFESAIQGEYDKAMDRYREKYLEFDRVGFDDSATEAVQEIELDDSDLAEAVRGYVAKVGIRRDQINEALVENSPFPRDLPVLAFDLERLENYVENLKERATELRRANQSQTISQLKDELCELEARQVLADHLPDVLEAVERKKRIAAYQLCIGDTRTNAITQKSSEVTRRAVTEQLTESFAKELMELNFRHVEVQMVASGGARGVLYHKLQLRRAPDTEISKVVSEGESRCLSIASFFAELSTAEDQSAILFDDPVSSLDHVWRESVAKRLVNESRSRQVIVFTHDIVFLLALVGKAEELGVNLKHQYLRRERSAPGFSSQQLPWPAMKVKERIGYMNNLCQEADKEFRKGDRGKYERDAAQIYGLLRAAWERGFEEVLLAGTVERYRQTVQTQRADCLADITVDDLKTLKAGMTKCSRWLTGHDQAAAEQTPFPEPDELKQDVSAFDEWIKEIQKRRKN